MVTIELSFKPIWTKQLQEQKKDVKERKRRERKGERKPEQEDLVD